MGIYQISDGEDFDWTLTYHPFKITDSSITEKDFPQLERMVFDSFFSGFNTGKRDRLKLVGNLSIYEARLREVEFVGFTCNKVDWKNPNEPCLELKLELPRRNAPQSLDKHLLVPIPIDLRDKTKSVFDADTPTLRDLNKSLLREDYVKKLLLLVVEDNEGFGYTQGNPATIRAHINNERDISRRLKGRGELRRDDFSYFNSSGKPKIREWCLKQGEISVLLDSLR